MLCFRKSEVGRDTAMFSNREPNSANRSRRAVLARMDSEIDRALSAAYRQGAKRALFIGTGESGKSTVFKQMRINYGNSFTVPECMQYAKLIWTDTLQSIRRLVDLAEARGLPFPDHLYDAKQTVLSLDLSRKHLVESEKDPEARWFLEQFTRPETEPRDEDLLAGEAEPTSEMRPRCEDSKYLNATRQEIAHAVQVLWSGWPELQELAMPAILESNGPYFFQRLSEFARPNCLATPTDIVNARLKTTGIVEATFDIRGNQLTVMDVGGQRIERSKWVHCFDDVTCIFFVVAVSEFDQMLQEDSKVNRLTESLEVFDQCINSKWLRDKPVTIFLNKMDVLESKLAYCSFKEHYPAFTGNERDPDQVVNYIERMFKERIDTSSGVPRGIYTHRTCATDMRSMKFVIEAVTDMIFVQNMQWAGMV